MRVKASIGPAPPDILEEHAALASAGVVSVLEAPPGAPDMPEARPERQRREVLYSGRVQGVGFRYTARHLAERFEVTGFVRNLPDGRVQLIVEGVPAEVEALLRVLADQMSAHVREAAIDQRPATGEFTGFEIRY